jgi:hypothetical protein
MGLFRFSNSVSDDAAVAFASQFNKSDEGILLLRKSVYV